MGTEKDEERQRWTDGEGNRGRATEVEGRGRKQRTTEVLGQ